MAYEVVTAPGYEARLEIAVEYRLAYWGPNSARKLISTQEKLQSLLAETPLMGAFVEKDSGARGAESLRWYALENYIAVYRVHPEAEVVVLSDLFYGSENWREKLGA